MKKIRLKKLGHLYATDEMLCMAEQDIPENKKIGWQRVEPVFQREVYLQSKICDGIWELPRKVWKVSASTSSPSWGSVWRIDIKKRHLYGRRR